MSRAIPGLCRLAKHVNITLTWEGEVEEPRDGVVHYPSRPFNNPNPFVLETPFRVFFSSGVW